VSEEDILNATTNFLFDGSMDNDENKRLLLGFDTRSNLIEVMYEVVDEARINIFHAMKARKALVEMVLKR